MSALTKIDGLTESDMGAGKTNGFAQSNGSKPNGAAAAHVDEVAESLKEGAKDAADYLKDLVRNKEAGATPRLEAARTILDRSGYGAQSRIAAPPIKAKKDLSDMSADELRSIAGALQVELSNRAKVIEHAPSDATDSEDMADLLG